MPKRVLDFDAMWGSDKLASCAAWAQAEYAWFYGLADASGCFELTNLRVIWGRVAAVRHDLPLERLERIFQEFHEKGLLFIWEENGKRYGHWSGSDVPGRLPPPSWRMRLERLAPPVPKQQYAEYMARFARGRAASPGGSFQREAAGPPEHKGGVEQLNVEQHNVEQLKVEQLKPGLEEAPEQDLDLDWNQNRERKKDGAGIRESNAQSHFFLETKPTETAREIPHAAASDVCESKKNDARAIATCATQSAAAAVAQNVPATAGRCESKWQDRARERERAARVELNAGRGPSDERCAPIRVKNEALERMRAREAARARDS